MTKKGKKAQKGAIVDGVVAAAEANPSILANLSAAESAPAFEMPSVKCWEKRAKQTFWTTR